MLRQVLRSEGGCQTKERARKSRWPHHKTTLPRKYRSHRGQLICFAHDISSRRGGLPPLAVNRAESCSAKLQFPRRSWKTGDPPLRQTGLWPVEQPGRLFALTGEAAVFLTGEQTALLKVRP